jgi:hypothetical protein
MLSQNPADPQPQPSTKTAEPTGAVLDPHSPIEVGTSGNGTTTDPSGTDTKPPAPYSGADYLPEA